MGPARTKSTREDVRVHRVQQVCRTVKHYLNHPCVLVRLTRIRLDALRDLVVGAHRFVNVQMRSKSDIGSQGTSRPLRDRH